MDIWSQPVEAVLAGLRSGPRGLAGAEAARRLAEFGRNRIEPVARHSLAWAFAREFTNFFALILWLAAALAFVADHYQPGEGMGQMGWAIIVVILVNGSFSFWQAYRAERAIAALQELLPEEASVWRDGSLVARPVEEVVPGDVLFLQEGDNVPADCRLIEAVGLRVNAATLTGESRPAGRGAEPVEARSPLEARNLLLAGTAVVAGHGQAVVFATGMRTEFGHIARLTQGTGETASPLSREIARVSRLVALLASGLGVIFFFVGRAMGVPFWDSFLFAIGIIVANVPEGLLPTVTLSLAMASQRMARRNALVRHLPAVEALGTTTVICTDKTGTLTENRMGVVQVFAAGVVGDARPGPGGGIPPGLAGLLAVAANCHNLRPDGARTGGWSGDPMEVALAEYAAGWGLAGQAPRSAELPFTTERRRMSVVAALPEGPRLLCKGAPEILLALSRSQRAADGQTVALDARAVSSAQAAMTRRGLRVIALASRPLQEGETVADEGAERDLVFEGLIGLEDPPRPDVAEAIAKCRRAGIRVIMVTGDHPGTALAIGREIGLIAGDSPRLLKGDDIARMNAAQLQLALEAPEVLCARVASDHKMRVVQALQAKGEVVAVTGDGVNDAPALKTADIGIAMGRSGTDVAKEAADMVLLDDHFASIVHAVEEGRAVFDNLRKFLTYILTSNIPEIVPYLAFVLLRVPLPLTVIQILAVDLGTDMLPALALGAEPPQAGVMERPPRARSARLLDAPLVLRAYLFLGVIEAAAALVMFFGFLLAGGWSWGDELARLDPFYREATTACLATIVVMQVVNLFLCRDPRHSAWPPGLTANPLLLAGVAFELSLILLVVYTPLGNRLFGTAPLAAGVWLLALPMALGLAVLEEGRKAWMRRYARSR